MKNKHLLNIIGEINEKYIEEAAPGTQQLRRFHIEKWGIMAACFALVALLGITGLHLGFSRNKAETATLQNGESIKFIKSDNIISSTDSKFSPREMGIEESKLLFRDLPITAYMCIDAENRKAIGFEGMFNDCKLIVTQKGINLSDVVIEGSEFTSNIEGIDVFAGYFVSKPNSKSIKTVIYYASFEIGNNSVYVECAGNENERETTKSSIADTILKLIKSGGFDLSLIQG